MKSYDSNRPERHGYSLFRRIIAHVQLVISIMTLVFFVIDRVNTAMEFMDNEMTKWLVAVLALLTAISSIMTIVAYWPKIEGEISIEGKKE